jgi:hypothetical protein
VWISLKALQNPVLSNFCDALHNSVVSAATIAGRSPEGKKIDADESDR